MSLKNAGRENCGVFLVFNAYRATPSQFELFSVIRAVVSENKILFASESKLSSQMRSNNHMEPSIAAMLQRYLQLKPALSELDLDDHDVQLLSSREDKRVEVICKNTLSRTLLQRRYSLTKFLVPKYEPFLIQ